MEASGIIRAILSLGEMFPTRRERIATEFMAAMIEGTDLKGKYPSIDDNTLALNFVMARTDALIARFDKDAEPKRCEICGSMDCHNPDEKLIA